jgi:hypothetical protein
LKIKLSAIYWETSSIKKELNPVILNNLDECGRLYIKQNKPGIEKQILHDVTHLQSIKHLSHESVE